MHFPYHFSFRRAWIILALFIFAFSLFPLGVISAQAASCTAYHTVQKGETLYMIGLKYNLTWDKLVSWNALSNPNKIYTGQKLCVAISGAPDKKANKIPQFTIQSVVQGKRVTIVTQHFPAHQTFEVRMGKYGTLGVKGILVQTVKSGSGGSLTYTFKIPKALRDANRIAIRLESPASGYYSYNWFYNLSTK
jgi:LysM repeat protein